MSLTALTHLVASGVVWFGFAVQSEQGARAGMETQTYD